MPEVFFTADTHFFHAAIPAMVGRRHPDGGPFADVREMDEELVRAWNATVPKGSIVWHLGDFAVVRNAEDTRRAKALLSRLNGQVFLVRGNHEDKGTGEAGFGWAGVFDMQDLRSATDAEGKRHRFWLCHYPVLSWPGAHRGVPHLHGHSHGRIPSTRLHLDVGVDAVSAWTGAMRPVSVDEIRARMALLPEHYLQDAGPFDFETGTAVGPNGRAVPMAQSRKSASATASAPGDREEDGARPRP